MLWINLGMTPILSKPLIYLKQEPKLIECNFREWFIKDGKFKPAGSLVIPTALCKTLRMVRDNGGNDLYNGTLSKIFLEDLKEAGSIITKEDLEAYT